jgi:hypothetical protein
MKKATFFTLFGIITLMSCNSPVTKKVLIMGRGQITANGTDITMNNGSGYAEETVEVKGEDAVIWNITTPSGKTTVNIPAEKGFYILNLKTDTIVGSEKNLGKDLAGRTMTQEELRSNIDSLIKLTSGSNVSEANHNYFILPNQLVKVSDHIEAQVFGPFNKIPQTIEVDKNGNAPQIFKFYTNTGLRELIENLKKNTY